LFNELDDKRAGSVFAHLEAFARDVKKLIKRYNSFFDSLPQD
jgi:hypothetical protein